MSTRFRHAALVGKFQSGGIREELESIARFLGARGLRVSLEQDTALHTGITAWPSLDADALGAQCDIAVVLGGDGTMLGIARQLARHGTPLVGINQGRLGFITDIAFGAFAAFLLHAGADWDWQMTAITLTALTCAVGLLTSAPTSMRAFPLSGRGVRAGILVAIALLAVCALVGLRGNAAAAASQRAASVDHWAAAEGDARTAVTWEPWSADARIALGVALLGEGRDADARTAFRAAIAREPLNWEGWFDLARASTGTARQTALARAKQLDPREPQVNAFH